MRVIGQKTSQQVWPVRSTPLSRALSNKGLSR